MKKNDIINKIAEYLKKDDNEIVVKSFTKLRNGRWGYMPYCLCWDGDTIKVRPFSKANVYWRARLEELTKAELTDILERTELF